jgi:hypothetical protein
VEKTKENIKVDAFSSSLLTTTSIMILNGVNSKIKSVEKGK